MEAAGTELRQGQQNEDRSSSIEEKQPGSTQQLVKEEIQEPVPTASGKEKISGPPAQQNVLPLAAEPESAQPEEAASGESPMPMAAPAELVRSKAKRSRSHWRSPYRVRGLGKNMQPRHDGGERVKSQRANGRGETALLRRHVRSLESQASRCRSPSRPRKNWD